MMKSKKVGALILSGGKSRRMGRDKTTAKYGGETFLSRAVNFWKSVPGIQKIYLSVGSEEHLRQLLEDSETKAILADDCLVPVFDIYPDCGPMAGIHAAFSAGEEAYLYVCAIDMLKMELSALPKPEDSLTDAWVYRYQDKIEPLFALYSRRVLKPAETLLLSGSYKMHALLDAVRTEYIPLRKEQMGLFYNCNTPEDLERLNQLK